jgi:hypothetical protein
MTVTIRTSLRPRESPNRPDDESDAKEKESGEQLGRLAEIRKELRGKYRGKNTVNAELVELDKASS